MTITHEIITPLAVLSTSGAYEKQVNVVSWNGAPPVVDIRTWNTETGNAGKGVTIKPDEVGDLITALERCRSFLLRYPLGEKGARVYTPKKIKNRRS